MHIDGKAKEIDPFALTYGFRFLNHYYIKTEGRMFPAFLMAPILILVLMILNFRNVSDVMISLITLFVAVIWTFGMAGLLGWNTVEFSSNGISNISSMRHFGLLAAFSIFLVFILNLTFVPALRELLDLRKAGRAKIPYKRRKHEKHVSPITEHLTNLTRKKGLAVMIALVLGVIASLGWTFSLRMKASYDPTGELSKEFEVTRAYEILNDRFDIGTESVFIRINGDLTSPKLWKDIQEGHRQNGRRQVRYTSQRRTVHRMDS